VSLSHYALLRIANTGIRASSAETDVETGAKRRATEDNPDAAESVKRPKTSSDDTPAPGSAQPADADDTPTTEDKKEKRTGGFYKEAPFTFIPEDSEVLQKCLFVTPPAIFLVSIPKK
jgi:hypothetical protein